MTVVPLADAGAVHALAHGLDGSCQFVAENDWEFSSSHPAMVVGVAQARRQNMDPDLAWAGVVHDDLHPGNLLFHTGAGGEIELHLIDLHAVRFVPSRPWPTCRDNLVIFNRFFILRADRSDRLRFWTAYHAARRHAVPIPFAPAARDSLSHCFWSFAELALHSIATVGHSVCGSSGPFTISASTSYMSLIIGRPCRSTP